MKVNADPRNIYSDAGGGGRGKRVSFLGSFHTSKKTSFQMLGETWKRKCYDWSRKIFLLEKNFSSHDALLWFFLNISSLGYSLGKKKCQKKSVKQPYTHASNTMTTICSKSLRLPPKPLILLGKTSAGFGQRISQRLLEGWEGKKKKKRKSCFLYPVLNLNSTRDTL